MEKRSNFQPVIPIILIFIGTELLLLFGKTFMTLPALNFDVALTGNLVLVLATCISFRLYRKALQSNNTQAFLRLVYGGMFLKMMVCLLTAFIYILVAGNNVSKAAIFTCFGLYFIYSFVEVKILMQMGKHQKKNV